MMLVSLFNILTTCLIIHLICALENEQNETFSLCQIKIRSCWCNQLKLECKNQLRFAEINKDTKFTTSVDNFYPHSIDLSDNGLKYFNASNFLTEEQRRHIKVLDLSHNTLGDVESFNLDAFENLRVLNLSRNHLCFYKNDINSDDDSPRRAFNWSSTNLFDTLEVLEFASTTWGETASFPLKFLSKFKKLKRFVYDSNNFFLDEENANYKANTIEELSINNCDQLKNLSAEFLNMFPNLKKLWARNNKIQKFPDIFGLKNLKYLDLSRNNLRGDISTQSSGVQDSSVETLLLSRNEYFDFPSGAFSQFPNLTVLDISMNAVALEISKDAFHYTCRNGHGNCKMRELNLEGCRISKLSESMLDWKKITNLNIKNNLFICDADLEWLILDFSIPIEGGVEQAFCGLPAILGGRTLRTVKKEEIQNPTQTSLKQYLEKVVDCFASSERIFFFILGSVSTLTAVLTLLFCFKCVQYCFRRVNQKHTTLNKENGHNPLL